MNLKESLFQLCPQHEFFEKYFEKQALFMSNEGKNDPSEIFGYKDLDDLLSTQKLNYPHLKIYKDGIEVPFSAFEKKDKHQPFSYADISKSIEYFSKGHSLIINRIDRLNSRLNALSRELESDIQMEVQVNLYLTPADNFGFDIHFDSHDVFILQLAGTKSWTLYQSDTALATDQIKTSKPPQQSFEEEARYLLKTGDVLYVPRGKYHQAKSTDETSMHLTIGVFPLMGYQLVQQLAAKCQNDLFFRKSPPLESASQTEKSEYYQSFVQKLHQLITPLSVEEAISQGRQRMLKQQDLNFKGILLNQLKAHLLNEHSVIRMRPGVRAEIKAGKRAIKIIMPQQVISLPVFLTPLVNDILAKREILVSSIKNAGVNPQKSQVLNRLIVQGLIEVVEP